MYNPARFTGTEEQIKEIVTQFPFATLITGAEVSHVPLVLENRAGEWFLVGHLARANAHWKALESADSLAIFHGPDSYISPLWYEEHDVPTWNYVVAHLKGRARLLENEPDTISALKMLSAKMNDGWQFAIPEDLAQPGALMKSIIGFEIPVSNKSAKLKLSQNRSSSDFQGVLRGLATRKDEKSGAILRWMQRLAGKSSK